MADAMQGTVPVPSAKQVAAVAAGNALEFYDFLTYAFFAAQIGRTFFPSTHSGASLLASLATFGAGFLMRPVGAVVIGRIADKVGRKPAMLLSFTLMGCAMVGLALTPSFAMIGIAAPIIVILMRLVQGFALGGEVGPSTAYLMEAAPPHRRGIYVSLQYMSQEASVLAAGLIGFGLASALSPASLDAWGWRVAFLVGAVIVPFGLILRRSLAETLHAHTPADKLAGAPPKMVWLIAVLAFIMLMGGTIATYVMSYLTTYATETLGMTVTLGFAATIVVGLTGVVFSPIGGWMADRYGRKPVMVIPWLVLAVAAVPAFHVISQFRTGPALLWMTAGMSAARALASASVLVAVTESIPKHIRSGALGLIYAGAISVFGGTTQFTIAWLTQVTESPMAPAWYMTVAVVVSLVAMIALPRTHEPATVDAEGDEIVAV